MTETPNPTEEADPVIRAYVTQRLPAKRRAHPDDLFWRAAVLKSGKSIRQVSRDNVTWREAV